MIKRLYQQAIKRDPNFAAAHAGLAYYYFNREQSEEGIASGRAAAELAIALDPELSDGRGAARACFELLRYVSQGDFSAYERAQLRTFAGARARSTRFASLVPLRTCERSGPSRT